VGGLKKHRPEESVEKDAGRGQDQSIRESGPRDLSVIPNGDCISWTNEAGLDGIEQWWNDRFWCRWEGEGSLGVAESGELALRRRSGPNPQATMHRRTQCPNTECSDY
jgi:hypothetical protein